MKNDVYASQLLAPYEPQLAIDRLVEDLNRLYHSYEASTYDDRHPEIRSQLPSLWSSMIETALSYCTDELWDVLDFGCGTGFASAQVLSGIPQGQLRSLSCFDPSPEMLAQCQSRFDASYSNIRFLGQFEELAKVGHKYNLVVTNSVLHHLHDPLQVIEDLLPSLTSSAVWICGHEPSVRFYQNKACVELQRRYENSRNWYRYLRPRAYLRKLAQACGLRVDPAARTAAEAYRSGWFRHRPSREIVARLVDFHVAHSQQEVEQGRGFDLRRLEGDLRGNWQLIWHSTYNFLGPTWEGHAGSAWQVQCRRLRDQFPDDGANLCSVWRRVNNARQNAA